MSWHRFYAMARKELIQIRRDRRSLVIVLVMPLILMFLFGYGVSLDMKHVPIYVFDREGSQESQDLVRRFEATQYFHVVRKVTSYEEVVAAIDSGKAKMGLVLPHDFSQKLRTGGATDVQALIDASDDNTANVVMGYAEAVVRAYSEEMQLDWLRQRGRARIEPPLSVDTRTWYNENLESSAFIIPGVLALVMAVIGAFSTSLTIAREWERGTMEQLVSTPVTALEIMLGKLTPYFLIGMFDTMMCAFLAIYWFEVPFRGSLVTLALASSLFIVVVLCMGFFISVVAKSQLAASQMSLVATYLPAFQLSGLLFSIEQMPAPVQVFTHIVPARYYVSTLKAVFLKGSDFAHIRTDLLALMLFAAVLVTVATRAFHKRLG